MPFQVVVKMKFTSQESGTRSQFAVTPLSEPFTTTWGVHYHEYQSSLSLRRFPMVALGE
jgi:hypothetical protein